MNNKEEIKKHFTEMDKLLNEAEKEFEDFKKNYELKVPEHFNFAYDIVDEWAKIEPDKNALLWTNDQGEHKQYSFAEIKEQSDKTASFFQSLGIKKGDEVKLHPLF